MPFVTWQQPSKCCRRCMKSQSGEELCFHAGKDKSFHCWSPAMLNPGAVASGLLRGLSLWPGWLAAMCPKAPRVPQVSLSTALPCWEHRKVEMRKNTGSCQMLTGWFGSGSGLGGPSCCGVHRLALLQSLSQAGRGRATFWAAVQPKNGHLCTVQRWMGCEEHWWPPLH